MELSQQEYWSRLPFLILADLPNPGIEPASPALPGGLLTIEPLGNPPDLVMRAGYEDELRGLVQISGL